MSDVDVEAIREAAEKATPGPWHWSGGMDSRAIVLADDESFKVKVDGHPDARYIAAMDPQTTLALLDALAAARAEVETLRSFADPGPYEPSEVDGSMAPTWYELRHLADHNFSLYAEAHSDHTKVLEAFKREHEWRKEAEAKLNTHDDAIREGIAAEVLAALDEALHRRITHDWLILLGYDSEAVRSLPDTTEHEVAGCEATSSGYDCTNEAGESRHPFADEADSTAELVGFTLARVRLTLSTAKEATT